MRPLNSGGIYLMRAHGGYCHGNRGSTLVGAMLLMMLVFMFGSSTIQFQSSLHATGTHEMQTIQARYIAQAGIEYALREIDRGNSPDGGDVPFGTGNFSIVTDPAQSRVFSVGDAGVAENQQSVTTTFAKDCVAFDTSAVVIESVAMTGLRLTKTCNTTAILSKMWIDWDFNPYSRVIMMIFNGDFIYRPMSGIGLPGGVGAPRGDEIEVADSTLTTDRSYLFDLILFINPIVRNTTFTVMIEFADLSQIAISFRV